MSDDEGVLVRYWRETNGSYKLMIDDTVITCLDRADMRKELAAYMEEEDVYEPDTDALDIMSHDEMIEQARLRR